MRCIILLLMLLAAGQCFAQLPEGLGDLGDLGDLAGLEGVLGGILGDPNAAALAEKCGQYSEDQEAVNACSAATQDGTVNECPQACKDYLQGLPSECFDWLDSIFANFQMPGPNGESLSIKDLYGTICSGDITGTPSTPTESPSPSPSPDASPSPSPSPSPDASPSPSPSTGLPIIPDFNITEFDSDFECDTAAGFQWMTPSATLASISNGDPADAAIALESTCQDLNSTECCTEAKGNFTWVQYGLGAPMVVQGIRVVAPDGECCSDEECSFGGEPCNQRILNTFVYVANASMADIIRDVNAQYNETLASLAAMGTDSATLEAMRESYVWAMLYGNATAGYCNMINTYDVFADGTDGEMVNNGTINIGCGMGWLSASGFAGVGGIMPSAGVDGAVRMNPQGSWITLAKYLAPADDSLALCGIEVCARPAGTAAAGPTAAASTARAPAPTA